MKKMGKVAAILAGLSMMLAGAGTAYADDTAGTDTSPQTTQSQQATVSGQATQTQQAQADAAQAQSDQSDKDAAKTPAPATKQATPKAQAKAAAAGATINNVEAPQGVLKTSVYLSSAEKFKVTVTGLTIGQKYGIASNISGGGEEPAVGSETYGEYGSGFTADSTTKTVEVSYGGADITSAWFALVQDSGEYSDFVYGPVVSVYGGVTVSVVNLDKAVKLDSLTVEDVGQHTAGLKAHYTFDSRIANDVTKICLSTTVARAYQLSGKYVPKGIGGLDRIAWDCKTGFVDDKDDTTGDAYRVTNLASSFNADSSTAVLTGQWFSRAAYKTRDAGDPAIASSGELTSVIPGLLSGTKYGNWGYSDNTTPDYMMLSDVLDSNNTNRDPASMMYSGIVLEFGDGVIYAPSGNAAGLKNVQDFTTKAAANGPVASEQLTDANKGGIVGANDGKATAGSTYRLYVDSLKDTAACKAAVESNQYCYWTGYIYSTPKQLDSADGKASAVRVDKDGKAYVEYQIPSDTVNGDHKIALYDNDGNLLGWAPVTVAAGQNSGNNQNNGGSNTNQNNTGSATKPNSNKNNTATKPQKLTDTGSSVLVIAFAAIALLVAGVSVVVYRRRQA
ncbi:hypothetical protein BLI708_04145 [Bifidobacterium imperatoris]|uniref:Gram-positive cocci surface proteins LPxTG domain-containing protein n=1 Tax=Bifidobacterium imperatoris TaxID=2020965 RepID=A0A2N5ITV5_9BIFI|nr:hypothetical protein [Bifidobacterium imperatoris]PLS25371.1 hypothetical protein Tam1G_0573 [Bifidobacterium imperatoris]QSY58473.1 hypothetical protein BLI708_04145 [Bifidobacterium imperatoris]